MSEVVLKSLQSGSNYGTSGFQAHPSSEQSIEQKVNIDLIKFVLQMGLEDEEGNVLYDDEDDEGLGNKVGK